MFDLVPIQIFAFTIILSVLYILILVSLRRFSLRSSLIFAAAIMYALTIIDLTLTPIPILEEDQIGKELANHIIPFLSLYHILFSPFGLEIGVKTMLSHVIVLIPCGFLIPVFSKRPTFSNMIVYALVIVTLIELFQLAIGSIIQFNYRSASINDAILGLFGASIGYLLFCIIDHFVPLRSNQS